MLPWAMIVLQAALAAAVLHLLRWHVFPRLSSLNQRSLVLDVWAPLAIILPLVMTVAWVGHSVRDSAWPSLGGPVLCGYLALAMFLMLDQSAASATASKRRPAPDRAAILSAILAAVTGSTLLLLGAAHVMHILVGQVAFAIFAVALWMNTPDLPSTKAADEAHGPWLAMFLTMLCAAAMGAAAWLIAPPLHVLSAGILLVFAAASLLLAAMYAGPADCIRIGTWAAALGVLGTLGGLSIMHMIPQAARLVLQQPPADVRQVAFGFGAFALEAVMLLVLPLLALASPALAPALRRLLAAAILLGVAALAIWRLSPG